LGGIIFKFTIQGLVPFAFPEIPKSQRYATRPALEKIFKEGMLGDRAKRDQMIREAVERFGYTQRAVADYLGFHFTYVSRILKA